MNYIIEYTRVYFGQKYDPFSLLCKQMDIYLKCTALERLPQCQYFWPNPILVIVMYIACNKF